MSTTEKASDTPMKTTNRLARLREAREIVEELEDNLGEEDQRLVQQIRSDLQRAGSYIRAGSYDRHMADAMGRAAGLAIGYGWDDLADRATRVVDEEID